MKNFFVLVSEILTLFVSDSNVTTVHFDERVMYCDVALSKGQFSLNKRRSNRSISIFLKEKISKPTSMICYLEDGGIKQFRLTYSNSEFHVSVRAGNAGNNLKGKLVYQRSGVEVLEAEKNYILKTNSKTMVNGRMINGDSIISKWQPLRINGKEIKF